MQAAVFTSVGQFEIVERETPSVPGASVLLRVEACGVCGTDAHIYRGEFPSASFPLVAGHEFAGVVEATGPGVSHLRVGDHVAVDPNLPCGSCRTCRRGLGHLCRDLVALGVNFDGGFAAFSQVPARQAYKVSRDLPLHVAAMTEPVSCCLHGIQRAGLRPGDLVVVIGAGLIGQIMLQLCQSQGAADVVVSEPEPHKREMARRLGASHVVDPLAEDLSRVVADLTGGLGADAVIECVGSQATAQSALSLVGDGGTALFFGVSPQSARLSVSPYDVYRRELTLAGSFTNPFTFGSAAALLESGRLRVEALISHRLALADVVAGIELLESRRATKVVIEPQRAHSAESGPAQGIAADAAAP